MIPQRNIKNNESKEKETTAERMATKANEKLTINTKKTKQQRNVNLKENKKDTIT